MNDLSLVTTGSNKRKEYNALFTLRARGCPCLKYDLRIGSCSSELAYKTRLFWLDHGCNATHL